MVKPNKIGTNRPGGILGYWMCLCIFMTRVFKKQFNLITKVNNGPPDLDLIWRPACKNM